ncbi:hypothetical protein CC79DRAFT_1364656 [Sarocladium strictum]
MSAYIGQDRGIAASNSTLHIANFTVNGERTHTEVPPGMKPEQLSKSLAFDEMDNRRFDVDDEQRKAGTGKSTILKFAAERGHVPKRGHVPEKDELILMHFFNGRGTDIEKSAKGMYRTLLVQLLDNLPKDTVLPNSIGRILPQREGDWQVGRLVALFKVILRIQGHRRITCFVDALDECDDGQIRGMIKDLRSMIEGRERASKRFRVCFASRYYPHISVPQDLTLDLPIEGHAGHNADVAEYIRSTLIIRNPSLARSIRNRVQAKADGVFMWCNLVIANLNSLHDCGQLNSGRDAEGTLSKLPGELSALYGTMLGLDEDNSAARDPRTLTCLQFVLFADVTLHPLVIWQAIQLGELLDGRAAEEAVTDLPSTRDAVLAILHISKELVEVRDPNTQGAEVVQIVHESVRDFLLQGTALARLMGMNSMPSPGEFSAQVSSVDRLKSICIEAFYIHVRRGSRVVWPWDPKGLIKHTVLCALWYAEQSSRGGIDQSECLARIDDAWIHWQNIECALFRNASTSLGTSLTANDFSCLTRAYCRQVLKYDPTHISHLLWQSYRSKNACLDQSTIRVLVEECCSTHAQGRKKNLLMELDRSAAWESFPWGQKRPDGTTWLAHLSLCSALLATFVLVAIIPNNSIHAAEVFETAQTQGFEATLIMVSKEFRVSEIIPDFKEDALRWAIVRKHLTLVKELLRDKDVNVNSWHGQHNALFLAIENDRQAVIDLLLTRADLDIYAPDPSGLTVLQTAVYRNKPALVNQLLEWDAAQRSIKQDHPDLIKADIYTSGTLLHLAVEDFRASIVEIILHWTGSDLLSIRDLDGRTPYEKAVHLSSWWEGLEPWGGLHTPKIRERVVALLASAGSKDRLSP